MRMAATSSGADKTLRIFISYSHKDEQWRRDLETHLSFLTREGLATVWTDRRILPGEPWHQHISKKLETADIVLLLVSADFAASDYCWDIEMARALELNDSGATVAIPVILRPVDGWENSPLGHLQALPSKGKPITEAKNIDDALTEVARGIRQRIIKGRHPVAPVSEVAWYLTVECVTTIKIFQ